MHGGICILGAGSWGTALAISLAEAGRQVTLWVRREELAQELRSLRKNEVYLKGILLPDTIRIVTRVKDAVSNSSMVVCAVPSQKVRALAESLDPWLSHKHLVVSVAKGVENGTLMLTSEVLSDVLKNVPRDNIGVVYGPSHAEEVARGLPATVVASAYGKETAASIQYAFMSSRLRVYVNSDIVGVQVGGSVKNVMAIAAGISDGVGFGDNAKAAIVTRGISEIRKLGVAMGGSPDTFSGLSGIGDLVVTCMSGLSRNRYLGEQVGKGRTIGEIQAEMNMVAEGVFTTQSIVALARNYRVEMPISEAVYAILFEGKKPLQAVSELMHREAKQEDWLA